MHKQLISALCLSIGIGLLLSSLKGQTTFGSTAIGTTEWTESRLLETAERYEAGEILYFSTKEDFISYLDWYLTQYRLKDVIRYYSLNDWMSYLPPQMQYDRDTLLAMIREQFPLPGGKPQIEEIKDVCRIVREGLEYDLAADKLPLDESIRSGKGVCWHYAKIAKVLLTDAGIPTKIVYGTAYGVPHMWLCCQTDNGILYADPQSGIIDPEIYTSHYVAGPYVTLN